MPTAPSIDFDQFLADTEKAVRDGVYVALGLGVLGIQKAQVRRREFTKRLQDGDRKVNVDLSGAFDKLNARFGDLGDTVSANVASASDQLLDLTKSVDDAVSPAWAQLTTIGQRALHGAPANQRLTELAKAVDERLAPGRKQIEDQLDSLEASLPEPARRAVGTLRNVVSAPEATIRDITGLDS